MRCAATSLSAANIWRGLICTCVWVIPRRLWKKSAPCDGVISTYAGHAIGVTAADGAELLIHVGMNTVELNGEGYTPLVKEGDRVKRGQILLKFDIDFITKKGYQVVTPFVITNGDEVGEPVPSAFGKVTTSDVVMTYKK